MDTDIVRCHAAAAAACTIGGRHSQRMQHQVSHKKTPRSKFSAGSYLISPTNAHISNSHTPPIYSLTLPSSTPTHRRLPLWAAQRASLRQDRIQEVGATGRPSTRTGRARTHTTSPLSSTRTTHSPTHCRTARPRGSHPSQSALRKAS